MTIHRISSNERLSGAVTYKELVFLSGQVPGEGLDVATQTREVLARIDALLAEAGSDKDHLLNATIYLECDIGSGFAPMNDGIRVAVAGHGADAHHPAGGTGAAECAGGNQRDCGTQIIRKTNGA